jgi:hypothetical protein
MKNVPRSLESGSPPREMAFLTRRRLRLLLILAASVAICTLASHLAVGWLRIKAGNWGGYKHYGPTEKGALGILHCSSPGYDGIDWDQIGEALGGTLESWATPGSSPAEWELMHGRSSHVGRTFIAITAYDLNEYFLCDFRAEIVPFESAIRDLWQCGADWQFSRRILNQYPVMLIRKLFPTVGRSDGVMVGIRARLQNLLGQNVAAGDAPKFAATGRSIITEKVSDWTPARLQRRLWLMSAACQGQQSFTGPKGMALRRLLRRAQTQGEVVLVVLPLPPVYRRALMPPAAVQEFERALADLQRLSQRVQVIRLDQLPALDDNEFYYDLVHINMFGQEIATETLLSRIKEHQLTGELRLGHAATGQ